MLFLLPFAPRDGTETAWIGLIKHRTVLIGGRRCSTRWFRQTLCSGAGPTPFLTGQALGSCSAFQLETLQATKFAPSLERHGTRRASFWQNKSVLWRLRRFAGLGCNELRIRLEIAGTSLMQCMTKYYSLSASNYGGLLLDTGEGHLTFTTIKCISSSSIICVYACEWVITNLYVAVLCSSGYLHSSSFTHIICDAWTISIIYFINKIL